MILMYKQVGVEGAIDNIEHYKMMTRSSKYLLEEYLDKCSDKSLPEDQEQRHHHLREMVLTQMQVEVSEIVDNIQFTDYSINVRPGAFDNVETSIAAVIMKLKGKENHERTLFITDSEAYMCNDNGKTISKIN